VRLSVSAAYPASTELVRINMICVSVNLIGDLRGNATSTKDPVSTAPRSEGVARKVPTRASATQVGYFIFENLKACTQRQRSINQTDKFETQTRLAMYTISVTIQKNYTYICWSKLFLQNNFSTPPWLVNNGNNIFNTKLRPRGQDSLVQHREQLYTAGYIPLQCCRR